VTTFIRQNVNCPNCDETIEITVLTSTNTFGGQSTDFHSHAAGFSPLPLAINTCPHCAYSGFVSDFTEPIPLSAALKEKIAQELTPLLGRDGVAASDSYAFTAKLAEWRGASARTIADIYVRAAWCCVDTGNTVDEPTYRKRAIEYFLKAMADGEIKDDEQPAITYLIGEFYRRIGETDKARDWFNKVIDRAQSDQSWKQMALFATQQRDNPKEKF
jgi:hypothetical protein